ncbi:hypothetical protein CYY_002541 [Polysphondylium violaceum]|uniref:inorganic diphosphatase n=1 Tax=Polysphondylium violaceum TaxID=133409 RepID=A0A8J4Q1G3_9MYCE|nr:hypothetical protein CYY_002541 [Polysphondylium violaceum]
MLNRIRFVNNIGRISIRNYSTNVVRSKDCDFYAKEEGSVGTFEYRVKFFDKNDKQISAWHVIPMQPTPATLSGGSDNKQLYNFIVEMPKHTTEKMEVNTSEQLNPIKQDIKKGALRYIKHGKIPYNYGCIPQTWEDPHHLDPLAGYPGDNDPIDVVEVSQQPFQRGSIKQVKVLGSVPLIDEGETDWKVIVIERENPQFDKINSIKDLEIHIPGTVQAIKDWYQYYKVSEGKEANKYALDGVPVEYKQTHSIIQTTHDHWSKLIKGNVNFKFD